MPDRSKLMQLDSRDAHWRRALWPDEEKVMRDIELRQHVLDELDYDPRVETAHIGVTAENGVVTLSGHVGSYAEKLAAEQAARRVKGVHGLAQEIEVRFSSDKKTADDEIASRAVSILRWSAVLPTDAVQVKVQKGWVGLSGEVDWQYQRTAAENAVRKLSGVVGVVNSITLKPRVQAEDVQRRIENALKRHAELNAHDIKVSVMGGGRVALDGHVHDWQERYAVERAAWSAPGVLKVEDRLTIA